MKAPLVFDVKRTSTADGPGVRTVVFFKGCPLDCFWCHNPEGKRAQAQMACFSEKCVSCGTCRNICARSACTACGKCVAYCPVGARKLYGREYSVDELLKIVLADHAYYDATGGGVTLSGGECMLYPEYLAAVARACRENGVHVAIDTAGYVPYASFEAVLHYADLFLYDVKCLDSVLHKKGTGVDNTLILQNLERLIEAGKEIVVRTPVIPDFNEGEECERIKLFCKERNLPWEPLPYHSFGEDKKRALET